MGDRKDRPVQNVRLVRLPNGTLVTEDQAKDLQKLSKLNKEQADLSKEIELNKNRKISLDKRVKVKTNENKKEQDKDILEVWKKQEQIKKETERLEIEYELAKKMAKELKRKLKEQQVSVESKNVDDAFKDLLSPEAKSFTQKFKPIISNTKSQSVDFAKSAKLSAKKYYSFSKVVYKNHKKATIVSGVVLAVGIIGITSLIVSGDKTKVEVSEVQGASNEKKIPTNVTPDFATLIPTDKSIEDLGGFARVSPENAAPAYAFKDNISGTPIIVTQQKKPEQLTDQLKIEELAKSFNATKQVQIDQNVLYIGKSEKGPQSAIYVKDDLLVLIKAEQEINEIDWVQYVTNLTKK